MPGTYVLNKRQPACFLAQPNAEVLELGPYQHPLYYCGKVSASVGMGWGLQVCISKSPGNIDAAGGGRIACILPA